VVHPAKIGASWWSARIARTLVQVGGAIQIFGHAFTSQVHQAEIQASARTACVTGALEETGGAIQIFRHSFTSLVHQSKIVASFAFAAIASFPVKFCSLRKLFAPVRGKAFIKEILG
jgi:hypothetical protein